VFHYLSYQDERGEVLYPSQSPHRKKHQNQLSRREKYPVAEEERDQLPWQPEPKEKERDLNLKNPLEQALP
jgi:hypothetical protein